MPITTLQWNNGVAYGPRGTHYEIRPSTGVYDCYVFSPEKPAGKRIARAEGTREGAMLAAQTHVNALTELVGAESDAINSSGRTQLTARR